MRNDRQDETEDLLRAEIGRLRKTVEALMDHAEHSSSGNHSDFSLFQTTIVLDEQIRKRTYDLRRALQENEQINRELGQAKAEAELGYAELRMAQKELMESEERFKYVCTASNDVIWDVDAETGQTWVSSNYEKQYGFPSHGQAPSIKEFEECIHPDDREAVLASFADALAKQLEHWSKEFRFRKVDGSYAYVLSRAYLLRKEDGSLRFVGAMTDLTEKKRAEEALQAQALAEKANQAKSTFLSRMSHELRTPLNAILGFAQILEMYDKEGTYQECTTHILKGGQHLLRLINEVLDISRIESGHLEVCMEPVGLEEAVLEAISFVGPLAEPKYVSLEFTAAPPSQYVLADRQRLLQVLINLLSNAIKYNKPNGSVVVSYNLTDDGGVVVSVRDTGCGISEEMQRRVFMPFDRLDAEQKGEVEGTGLGLALSKSLVEAMGGRISFQSTIGEGTEFHLRFCDSELARLQDLESVDDPSIGSHPILRIESNNADGSQHRRSA